MDLQEKRILDSVHGNIYIDKQLVENIIDTPEFQRLRRVEQTSTRSIFPSARHDRFIHSLGVYYIGTLISKQLEKTGLKIIELML
jgi:HD superfamily phosphohydrolase